MKALIELAGIAVIAYGAIWVIQWVLQAPQLFLDIVLGG